LISVPDFHIKLDLPSPTRALETLDNRELWVKDEGRIHPLYGGNKPRKLQHLLEDALKRRARHLVTVGVVGSHHVLATGILGRAAGLSTTAILLPRPASYHAEQTTKQAILAGVELLSLKSFGDYPRIVGSLIKSGGYFVPPGGSNALGALGYLDALLELESQIKAGELPEPDFIFVALGSGGTAAGLLAGLAASTLRSRLVAVPILKLPFPRRLVETLAAAALRLSGRLVPRDLSRHLMIDSRWIGAGYGETTVAGEEAIKTAQSYGLQLESTYTAKAFAAALEWLRGSELRGNVLPRTQVSSLSQATHVPGSARSLFWSTISTTNHSQTEERAVTLVPGIQHLLRPPSGPTLGKPPQRNA
jgi:D-cysteine desulfhydrase